MGLTERIARYLFIGGEPEKADVILVPGSPFPEPMERAVLLYSEGWAPVIAPSGDRWIFRGAKLGRPGECDVMADIARGAGVPDSAVVREGRARHTLDNARLTRLALDAAGVPVRTALVCCQSFHARRCLKAYGRHFPEARLVVCPVPTRGVEAGNWHRTPLGVFKVCTELMKCTGLFFFLISFVRANPPCPP